VVLYVNVSLADSAFAGLDLVSAMLARPLVDSAILIDCDAARGVVVVSLRPAR